MNKPEETTKHPAPRTPSYWGELMRGIGLYTIIACLIAGMSLMGIMPTTIEKLLTLVDNSAFPLAMLGVISIGLTSLLFLIVRAADITISDVLNLNFFGLNKLLASPKVRPYVRTLPLGFHMIVVVISAVLAFFYLPWCQAPGAVKFTINDTTYHTGSTVILAPGESITITARPIEEKETSLSCEWQQAGNIFETINTHQGCSVTLYTTNTSGQGILTLVAGQRFCSKRAFFPIIFQVNADDEK